LSLSPFNVF